MGKKKNQLLIAVFVIGVVLVGASSLLASEILTAKLTENEAIESVKKFDKIDGVKQAKKIDARRGRVLYEITASDDRTFFVNASTGKVEGVVGEVSAEPVDKAALPLDKNKSINRAESYLKSHVAGFEELKLVETSQMGSGTYVLTWQKMTTSGVEVPTWVQISVDSKTGEMGSFVARDEKVNISTEPKIEESKAISIAEASTSIRIQKTESKLRVMKSNAGVEYLVWHVRFEGTYEIDPGMNIAKVEDVMVNAITGEIMKDVTLY